MTTYDYNPLASRFAALAPKPLPGNWEDVLGRAEAGGESVRRTPRAWFAVGGVATAAAVAVLILFWPAGGGDNSVLDRALAAVGTDPIIHVVLEAPPVEVYDLRGNGFGSVPATVEQWFLPEKGIHEVRTVGSQVVADFVLSYKPADFPEGEEQYAGVATAYRRALAAGEAALGPEETVDGHRVHWIRFSVPWFRGDSQYEIAVDAETYEPRFLRVDGEPIERVVTFETLPLGEGEFGPLGAGPSSADWLWSEPGRDGLRSPAEARATLNGALWLGERFRDLPLASITEFMRETGVPKGILPQSVRGLDLCYGSGDPCAVSVTLATRWHPMTGHGQMAPYDPPRGTLAFGDKSGVGFVLRDGVYVTLVARDRDEVIAAAKALTPIR
jgi:hypothetical protein